MSGCDDIVRSVERVRLIFIDQTLKPERKVWEGSISVHAPLGDIFERWVFANHPESPFGRYSFALDDSKGQPLKGNETCKDLELKTGSKVYAVV